MLDLSKKLDKYVKLSHEERQKKRKWLIRQSEELELEVFIRQQKYYFELSKYKNENKSLLYYAAHTLAISEIYDQMNPKKGKNKVGDLNSVIDSTELESKNINRRVPRKTWNGMLNQKYRIMKLHYLDVPSRDIAKKISNPEKEFTPCHTSICNFIKEMKEGNEKF